MRTSDALALGMALTTPGGRVAGTNRLAEEILRLEDGLCVRDGVLRATDPRRAGEVARLLGEEAGEGGGGYVAARLPRERSAMPLLLVAFPVPGGRLLVIQDPARRRLVVEPLLVRWLGLTRREAELTALLVDGVAVEAAAARLGISAGTARAHVRHVFFKCGVRSQMELVAKVAACLPPVDPAWVAAQAALVAAGWREGKRRRGGRSRGERRQAGREAPTRGPPPGKLGEATGGAGGKNGPRPSRRRAERGGGKRRRWVSKTPRPRISTRPKGSVPKEGEREARVAWERVTWPGTHIRGAGRKPAHDRQAAWAHSGPDYGSLRPPGCRPCQSGSGTGVEQHRCPHQRPNRRSGSASAPSRRAPPRARCSRLWLCR